MKNSFMYILHWFAIGILINILFAPVLLQAQDEFDFGDSFELVDDSTEVFAENRKKAFWSNIPARGKLALNSSRQISSSNSRWVENGPALYAVVDYFGALGKVYFDGNIRWNTIFRTDAYTKKTRERYEIEATIRELYYKKSFSNFTFTLGNEISSWSKLDFLPKIDRVSAIDQSKYFFADPEDILIGQNNIKLDFYRKKQIFSFIFVPFPRVNRFTEGCHPYSVMPGFPVEKTYSDLSPEFHCRYSIEHQDYSATFLAGISNNRSPVLGLHPAGKIKSVYDSYSYAGYSAAIASAPFLFKNEFVFDYQVPVQLIKEDVPVGKSEVDRINLGFGFDYNSGALGTLINEYQIEYITGKPSEYSGRRSNFHVSTGWSDQFINDRLNFSIVNQFSQSIKNLILRFDVSYDINNNTAFSCKYTGFSFGKGQNDYSLFEDYDLFAVTLDFAF